MKTQEMFWVLVLGVCLLTGAILADSRRQVHRAELKETVTRFANTVDDEVMPMIAGLRRSRANEPSIQLKLDQIEAEAREFAAQSRKMLAQDQLYSLDGILAQAPVYLLRTRLRDISMTRGFGTPSIASASALTGR